MRIVEQADAPMTATAPTIKCIDLAGDLAASFVIYIFLKKPTLSPSQTIPHSPKFSTRPYSHGITTSPSILINPCSAEFLPVYFVTKASPLLNFSTLS